jgi:peptidoglycan/LPS O-acetylase OafA/YrhL
LVVGSVLKEIMNGKFQYFTFLSKRIKRLSIPSTLCLIFIFFGIRAITPLSPIDEVIAACYHYANIYFYSTQVAYFKTNVEFSHVLHYWSLGNILS